MKLEQQPMTRASKARVGEEAVEEGMRRLEQQVRAEAALGHLHLRRRGATITLYSESPEGAVDHARLTFLSHEVWGLSLPRYNGRWEKTPFVGSIDDVFGMLAGALGFHLAPR